MIECSNRIDIARRLRLQGYNCAQAVLMCFDDVTGIDAVQAAKLTSALGTGVAATGEICGVANAIAIAVGATYGSEPEDKVPAAREANAVVRRFAAENFDCLRCADLKGRHRTCNQLVEQGVRILAEHFEAKYNS